MSFTVFFFFPVTLMCAGLSLMGMPARTHNAVPAPSPALLSAWGITVSILFKMAPMKCLFWVNEQKLNVLVQLS